MFMFVIFKIFFNIIMNITFKYFVLNEFHFNDKVTHLEYNMYYYLLGTKVITHRYILIFLN